MRDGETFGVGVLRGLLVEGGVEGGLHIGTSGGGGSRLDGADCGGADRGSPRQWEGWKPRDTLGIAHGDIRPREMETTEGRRTSSSSFLPGVCFSVESDGMGEDILSCFWKYFWAWVRIWTRERVGIYRRRHERGREEDLYQCSDIFPTLSEFVQTL